MVAIIISVTASIISGLLLFFLQRFFKNQERKEKEISKQRQRKNVLMFKSIKAIGDLTVANSVAIRDGKTNGEMHEAMNDYETVNKEIYEFMVETSTKK
jgi:membrane protein implicated in regulation of membrane protease activity